MKRLFLAILACLASIPAMADTVTITWTSPSDPQVGWNLYFNHLQTPDALQYTGTLNPPSRTAVFYNISPVGMYQFGISRVKYLTVNGVPRRVEGPVKVVTLVNGLVVSTPSGLGTTSVVVTP